MTHSIYSPDGQFIVTASDNQLAKMWDATNGKFLFDMIHNGWVKSATFSPDGEFILPRGKLRHLCRR